MGLERIRMLVEDKGLAPIDAFEAVRRHGVPPPTRPSPAGIDRFHHDLVKRYYGRPGGVPTSLAWTTC